MSTRSTTHFRDALDGKPVAIVYRHSDGYPTGAGTDLLRFLDEVKRDVPDNRFGDPAYLAAKYVVFLARMFSVDYDWTTKPYTEKPKASPLDFLSVGVVANDPGDIEYRYIVVCERGFDSGLPAVYVDALDDKGPQLLSDVLAAEAVPAE